MKSELTDRKLICAHCGCECSDETFRCCENIFCCEGCKSAFNIINEKNLCSYYTLDENPGVKIQNNKSDSKFDYLNDKHLQERLVDYKNDNITSVTFHIPSIHCTSCVLLLENLFKINPSVRSSKVNFPEKRVNVVFHHNETSLKEIVSLLASLGYEPSVSDADTTGRKKNESHLKKLYLKIGVAGFCLGNIMLFSFPEYLGLESEMLKTIFNYLNILLAIPVIFYCSSGYFISTWNSLKQKVISIDLPISIGLSALFVRSLYEIIFFNNAGFNDSLAGLVFLLLLGKLFQSKTYESLNFERDYKSYFPVSVTLKKGEKEFSVPLNNLKQGDRIIIRNNEIIPADSFLFEGTGNIDYSFVTGESIPDQKIAGEIIYAGGRHFGSAIELEVIRTVSQSYLTQLWNNEVFKKSSHRMLNSITNTVSKYFTFAVLTIAVSAFFYHLQNNFNIAINAFTAVLIVACPCALALTVPFALGNAMRIFGRNKFYLKNSSVIETLSGTGKIVFDKTGTITNSKKISAKYKGIPLTLTESAMVKSLVKNSSHPLSRKIYESIECPETFYVSDFSESFNNGISCYTAGSEIKLGTLKFLFGEIDCSYLNARREIRRSAIGTNVFLSIDNQIKGIFSFESKYREGLDTILEQLSGKYDISLISGDNSTDEKRLSKNFKGKEKLFFSQNPQDKLNYIKKLQGDGSTIVMIGDGLNDAGALKQSDVGISVSEDVTNFSPACDVIMDASEFRKLPELLEFSKSTMNIIKISFTISFFYNAIGLYLAAMGFFSPLIAAVLMPFNSISIILFVIFSTNFAAKRKKLL